MSDSTYTDRKILWPNSEPPADPTPAPVRPMPTETDVPEITQIARMFLGHESRIFEVKATTGGVLVRYHADFKVPAPALEAVGYRTTQLRAGLVLVTGAVDVLARLDAQIAALKSERARLLEQQTGAPF